MGYAKRRNVDAPPCKWRYNVDEDKWDTGCDNAFVFIDGSGPVENKCRYCPYCGAPIRVTK